jgi:hypothetical protein
MLSLCMYVDVCFGQVHVCSRQVDVCSGHNYVCMLKFGMYVLDIETMMCMLKLCIYVLDTTMCVCSGSVSVQSRCGFSLGLSSIQLQYQVWFCSGAVSSSVQFSLGAVSSFGIQAT